MHQSTTTLTTQHSYTFIKALKSPWNSPDRHFLWISVLVSTTGATAAPALCCSLPKGSCRSDFCRVQPSARKATPSVIPTFLLPLLVILIFHYSKVLKSFHCWKLLHSNAPPKQQEFQSAFTCQMPLVLVLPRYVHHLVALSISS